ncbi:MAG: hypothetical protein KDA24_02865 [Deltaproteobacteria bacterium]|nr:hypothetical protein [Deltaproteobacteria bacterium]
MDNETKSRARFVARYAVAAAIIPLGVAFGVGGLVQNWSRALRRRPRRSAPTPHGFPEDSGLRRVGDA